LGGFAKSFLFVNQYATMSRILSPLAITFALFRTIFSAIAASGHKVAGKGQPTTEEGGAAFPDSIPVPGAANR
jgi:hypothetical protein